MFENLLINIRSKLNLITSDHDYEEVLQLKPKYSTKTTLSNFFISNNAKYISILSNVKSTHKSPQKMFPRVYEQRAGDQPMWDPIDLAPKEKYVEELDNVIDKFVHVIRVDSGDRRQTNHKRNDREEIRRRLAMGAEDDYFSRMHSDKPGRKPSLHSRLQGGMNLQICFMNETASDTESPSSDSESCPKLSKSFTFSNNSSVNSAAAGHHNRYSAGTGAHPYNSRPLSVTLRSKNNATERARPTSLPLGPGTDSDDNKEIDFFTKQARLQIEARMALAQAKDMAHMQMEMDRQKQKQSPITEIIRNSLEKVGIALSPEKRRVSRQMLTDMNIAQLQVIVNELHTQIEHLNENLVQYLMERDELHMSQDSMLVDIEDLTRYLGAKEQTSEQKNQPAIISSTPSTNTLHEKHICIKDLSIKPANIAIQPTTRSLSQNKLLRIASLVKK